MGGIHELPRSLHLKPRTLTESFFELEIWYHGQYIKLSVVIAHDQNKRKEGSERKYID